MKAKVQKWGNSLGIRIPKVIAIKAELAEGSEVELDENEGSVTIRRSKRKVTLKLVLKSLKKFGPYDEETEWAPAIGNEIW